MSPLHRLALTALLGLAQSAFAEHGPQTSVFYPDGVNRHDGMSAVIDFEGERLSVAGDMFELKRCPEIEPGYCFYSDYMSFSAPPKNERNWTAADIRYSLGAATVKRIGEKVVCAETILSKQKTGTFEFYFNRGIGLIGWRIEYTSIDGQATSEEYALDKLAGSPANCVG